MMPRMNHRLLLTAVALMAAPVLVRAQATAASTAAAAAKPAQDTVRGLPIDGIAAIVGDQIILVSEVMTAVNQARASGARRRRTS